ncbi:MAG: hypothetical protein AB7H80_00315 [Candidatus Kapaibacterium sp.]
MMRAIDYRLLLFFLTIGVWLVGCVEKNAGLKETGLLNCDSVDMMWEVSAQVDKNQRTMGDSVTVEFLTTCNDTVWFVLKNHLTESIWYLREGNHPLVDMSYQIDSTWGTENIGCYTQATYERIPPKEERVVSILLSPMNSTLQKIGFQIYFDKEEIMEISGRTLESQPLQRRPR